MRPIAFLVCSFLPVLAAELPNEVAGLLKRHAGFTDEQVQTVRRGERVVRTIDTGSASEVAFAGVTRLPVSLAAYLTRVRAGTLYKARDPILQVGRFSETPVIEDLAGLRFEGADLKSPAEHNRRVLLHAISQYEEDGATRFGPLEKEAGIVELESLAQNASYLQERFPAAYDYLLHYPKLASRGRDDYYLWKQLAFGFRPVTRVAQVAVWEENRQGRREAIVLTKQIYANRYFDASFQIDHLIADESDSRQPAVWLITLNYGRSAFLEGITGKVIRPIVLSRTRAAAEKALDDAKKDFQLERL